PRRRTQAQRRSQPHLHHPPRRPRPAARPCGELPGGAYRRKRRLGCPPRAVRHRHRAAHRRLRNLDLLEPVRPTVPAGQLGLLLQREPRGRPLGTVPVTLQPHRGEARTMNLQLIPYGILTVLFRHRTAVVSVFLAVLVAGVAYLLTATPKYESVAQL